MGNEGVYAMTTVAPLNHQNAGSQSTDGSHLSGSMGRGSSLSRTSLGGNRGSLVSMGKPTSATLASLAGLFKERDERAVSQAPDAQTRTDERTGDFDETAEKEFSVQRVRVSVLMASVAARSTVEFVCLDCRPEFRLRRDQSGSTDRRELADGVHESEGWQIVLEGLGPGGGNGRTGEYRRKERFRT
jgi:hypothetical protein